MHDTEIAALVQFDQENPVGAQVAGVELVAVAKEGAVTVFAGRCPHRGTLLSEGHIENAHLICRGHGWRFDCTTGVKIDDTETCLHEFSVVVDGGKIMVDRAEVEAWATEQKKRSRPAQERPLLTPEQLPGPRSLPILGNLHQLKTERFHLILEDWYRQYGDVYQFKLGPGRAVAIADLEMVHHILRERPHDFGRLSGIRQTIEEMGVQGLFSAEGDQWRRHRHLAARAFDVRHLRAFFPTMAKVARRLHGRWQRLADQESSFDVQRELMRYTIDVTTNLAFGYDMNTLEREGDRIQEQLERVFPMIAHRAFMPLRYWNYVKLPRDRALEASLGELQVSVSRFIDHAKQQLVDDPTLLEQPRNLLQALLAAQADEEVELSDNEIYGNVFTFLLAGEDTTANSMAWMMYFMTKHPDIQRKMQAEADAVVGDAVAVTEYTRTRELRYIEAVAHETMRFEPVATFLGLQALTDVRIDRFQIPAGTPVFVLLRPKGMEDHEFPAASEFKPERWLDHAPEDNPHRRGSFAPFGGGPRLCPGRSLALLEIKMAMSMICGHFDVIRDEPDRAIEERFVFTMMPKDLMISLRKRRG